MAVLTQEEIDRLLAGDEDEPEAPEAPPQKAEESGSTTSAKGGNGNGARASAPSPPVHTSSFFLLYEVTSPRGEVEELNLSPENVQRLKSLGYALRRLGPKTLN